ncbi:MAG: methylmalonyl-CoA mutase family protein [Microthrixaceae bacterium]
MTTEAEPTFAGEFPPATEEQWLALVDKVLKGAPHSKLRSVTPGGIEVEPIYTRTGSPGAADEAGLPGSAPFVRGSDSEPRAGGEWRVRSLLTNPNPRDANRTALRELERGAAELTLRFDEGFRSGLAASDPELAGSVGIDGVVITSSDDLATALEGVMLDLAPVHLEPGAQFTRAADLFVAVLDRAGVAADAATGGVGADPFGVLAASGRLSQGLEAALAELGALAVRLSESHPGLRTVRVDTSPYVEAGASEVQELAAMLATGAAYLRTLAAAGLDADTAAGGIEVTLCADADVFTTIAKLRAARQVWAAMTAACGVSAGEQAPLLHVRTADRMMTRRDPWVNMLRVTAASFAAGVGGAFSVTTAPFDVELGEPDELGRRMARNTQLLLMEESNVGRVTDPAGGSWYVETLTAEIAAAAWSLFGEIEAAGGLAATLADGSLADRIAAVRDERLARVATRKDPITGVSEFADIHEAPVLRSEPDLRLLQSKVVEQGASSASAGSPTQVGALPRVRWAQEFEQLRDASDAYLAATGSRPKVFLANLGPVAVHTARATFAKNFFEAGGIEAITGEAGTGAGYDDPGDAVRDVMAAGAHLVCLCSSDSVYAQRAVDFARALSSAGLTQLYLAGNPGERRDAEQEAGVSQFIHVGVDVLDVLRRAHESIGTPSGAVAR